MSQYLTKYFESGDFNLERFVKEFSSQCVGAEELRQQRAKIQALANDTSALLKRNVYQNYIEFIETSKEISHLESEMYQLSQLLTEQRSLLGMLNINQSTGISLDNNLEESKNSFYNDFREESKHNLMQLLDNVEGATKFLETPGRICVHHGTLLELDPFDSKPLKKIDVYLFNDVLMITSWLSSTNGRGLQRCRIQAVYDLQSLAVVNIRDLGPIKFAFKLLAFSDTRVFQCATAISKKEWLEKCDQAKRVKIPKEYQPIDLNEDKATIMKGIQSLSSGRTIKINEKIINKVLPEWILEISEDLDSCIAQRHFEEAYNLLLKGKQFLNNTQDFSQLKMIKVKMTYRNDRLVNVLTKELERSAESKSLLGEGLRSAKRAVKLLVKLKHSTQACQLYLMLCSITLKERLKKVNKEGPTLTYFKKLSAIALSSVAEMTCNFLRIFQFSTHCVSAVIVWCGNELGLMTSHLSKQLFIPQVTLNVLVECLTIMHEHCKQLSEFGMEFRYQLDAQIRNALVKILEETEEKYVDLVKIRASEDIWKPINFETTLDLNKLRTELQEIGLSISKLFHENVLWIPLTSNTLIFSKLYMGLLEDCLNIQTPEIIKVIEKLLISVLSVQIQILNKSLNDTKHKHKQKVIGDNIEFIRSAILSRTLKLYESTTGHQFDEVLILQGLLDHKQTTCVLHNSQLLPRNTVSKYSSTEYI